MPGNTSCRAALMLGCLLLAGCGPHMTEQVRLYNEDGIHLLQQGKIQAAKETFEEALVLKPKDPNLEFNLGLCYDRLGQSSKAEEQYQKCLEKVPNHAECIHALAVLMMKTGRRKEMDAMITTWLQKEPTRADPYIEDAWRLRQDGELLQAQGRLQQALELEPRNTRALADLGFLFEQLEYPDRARALYEDALTINPRQPEVADRLNQLCARGVGRPRPNQ